jgi:hypothetical protein
MCITNVVVSAEVSSRDRKRKLSNDSLECYRPGLVPPKFISAKMMKAARRSSVIGDEQAASFETLPQELFCTIVAYLGPTSMTLCRLAQVTKGHRDMMKTIGDVMLPVAKSRFRIPLPPMSNSESSISLFVRHARIAKNVHDNLLVLEETLKKDFPTLEDVKEAAVVSQEVNTVTTSEVDRALDVALCLLGAGHYSNLFSESSLESSYLVAKIANGAATTALEWKVSSLCAALGAKAYKYAKTMMCDPREVPFSAYYQVSDEYNEEDDYSVESQHSIDEDVNRLDKACMVMQLTVSRDIEIARQIRLATGMSFSAVAK